MAGRLTIHERGLGPVVVLLHGAPSTVAHFERLADALAARYRVVVPELPGYGTSPRLAPYVWEKAHAMLEDALLARAVSAATVVGFSGGVYRGAALAVRGRVRVRALYALGGGVHFADSRAELLAIARLLETPDLDPKPILIARMLSAAGQKDDAAVRDVASWMSTTTTATLRDEIVAYAEAEDLRAAFAETGVPFVCRVGTADVTGAVDRAASMVAAAPDRGQLEWVEGAGHALLLEDWEATRASVEGFLGALG